MVPSIALVAWLGVVAFGAGDAPAASGSLFRGDLARTGVSESKLVPPFQEKWVAPIGLVNASASIAGDSVYVGSYDGHFFALDAGTGKIRWKVRLGEPIYASAALADGQVFICCLGKPGVREKEKQQSCQIFCLQADTGKLVWKQPLLRDDVIYDLGNWAGGWSSPILDKKHVYVGSDDRFLYALHRSTGVTAWKFRTEGRVHSSPTLVDGKLYSGSHDGAVYALEADTGKFLWKFKSQGLVNSTVAFRDGQLYFGSYDKHVYALKAADGSLLWKTLTDPDKQSHIVASPTVTDQAVLIGTWPGTLVGLDRKSGKLLWETALGGRMQASSTAAQGVVYTLAHHRLVGVNVNTGKLVWEQQVGRGFATSTPTVASGALYVGSRAGLHCFVPRP